jgi:antitoxin component YwqK of YwqJK toxin-antitoxin module
MKTGNYYLAKVAYFFIFLFLSLSVYSQKESIIYIGKNGKLTTLDHAEIMQKITVKSAKTTTVKSLQFKDTKWKVVYTEQFKKENDSTYLVKSSSESAAQTNYRIFKNQEDGVFLFKDIHKDKIVRIGYSTSKIPLTLHGLITEYYPNGQKKSISEYLNNELISNQNWNVDGEEYINNIFYSTDIEPSFVPGNSVLHHQIIKGFKDAGIDISAISGSLIIGFVVMEDGKIEGMKVLKGLGPTINSVAIESLLSLKGEWKPARLNNQNVRYFQVFPINFIYKTQSLEFAEMGKGMLHWGAY